jgi:hypothetical protein
MSIKGLAKANGCLENHFHAPGADSRKLAAPYFFCQKYYFFA